MRLEARKKCHKKVKVSWDPIIEQVYENLDPVRPVEGKPAKHVKPDDQHWNDVADELLYASDNKKLPAPKRLKKGFLSNFPKIQVNNNPSVMLNDVWNA